MRNYLNKILILLVLQSQVWGETTQAPDLLSNQPTPPAAKTVAPTGEVPPATENKQSSGVQKSSISDEQMKQGSAEAKIEALQAPPPIPTLFSVEDNPGRGTLEFIVGKQKRKVEFGQEAGRYLMAMAFDTKTLPQPYRYEFGRNIAIQIIMGTIPSKRAGEIAQFGLAAILTRWLPKERTAFALNNWPITSGRTKTEDGALLMFSDPQSSSAQTDEQKLQSHFFGRNGFIALTPIGDPASLTLANGEEKYQFKSRVYKITFDAEMGTPFNPVQSSLRGTAELPVYWPIGVKATALLDQMSQSNFTGPDTLFPINRKARKLSNEKRR